MVDANKKNVLAAVAGAVVGAGAVIASVVAMKDRNNQKKVSNIISNAKEVLKGYTDEVSERSEDTKENIKKMANKAIASAEQVTKSAKKEVKKI